MSTRTRERLTDRLATEGLAIRLKQNTAGISKCLPTGPLLSVLEVCAWSETLRICISDRKDFYHQLKVSPQRAITNCLWPQLAFEDVKELNAFKSLEQEALCLHSRTLETAADSLGSEGDKQIFWGK